MSIPQTEQYSLRLTKIAGAAAVYVINKANGAIYTVNSQRRCNCPHFVHRCDGQGRICKHVEMADSFLMDQDCATCPATVPPAEATVSTRAHGAPHCSDCREADRKPYLDPERAARMAELRRRRAELWG